jgi:hypothetical protein
MWQTLSSCLFWRYYMITWLPSISKLLLIIMIIAIELKSWWFVFKQPPLTTRRSRGAPSCGGMLVGQPLCSCWYWCVDQTMVQRVLSAKGCRNPWAVGKWAVVSQGKPSMVRVMTNCQDNFHKNWGVSGYPWFWETKSVACALKQVETGGNRKGQVEMMSSW